MKKARIIMIAMLALTTPMVLTSCKKATINVNNGSGNGDVTGKGGDASETFTWDNAQERAEYNFDITASSGGSMQLQIQDADGTEVANETLTVGVGDDSKSGCSSPGTPGTWTITITLDDFDGDGTYSLSQGC